MRRYWTTKPLQILFPNLLWRTRADGVHLTFDDGPDPVATPNVLDILLENSIKATFFLLGAQVHAHPALAKRMAEEGHVLGLHAYDHIRLAFRGAQTIKDQLERTRSSIQLAAGTDARLFRPPYGFFEPSLIKHVTQMGYRTVMWDVDPGDSFEKDPERVVKLISSCVRPGSIILLHDNVNTRERVEPILRAVLDVLKRRSLSVMPLAL